MSKNSNSKETLEFVHTLDSIAIKKQKEEIERLNAEVKRLEGNIFGWKGTVMGQDSILKCRSEEIELLKADIERRTNQYNSIIDQQLDIINDLKTKVEHIDLFKSVVEKFFNSADLKNQSDAESCYALAEKLKQLPDCILDFTEEQVRDNPAWALAVFRHKVKEMQYKRVHDLNAIGGEQEENARLKSERDAAKRCWDSMKEEWDKLVDENIRLRKAGDAMQKRLIFLHDRWDSDEPNVESDAWNAAKEGKPSV